MTPDHAPRRLGIDADGFITVPPHEAPLSASVQALVAPVVDRMLRLPAPPHGIYLELGAWSADALPRDVELVVVMPHAPTAAERAAAAALRSTLDATSAALGGAAIGLELGDVSAVVSGARSEVWRFWLRHCCRCIYGADLGLEAPPRRPSWSLAQLLHADIGERAQEALDALTQVGADEVREICRTTARRLVWAAFGLVMAREESWTTDLDRCCELFAPHFPRWRAVVQELALLAREPSTDRGRVSRPVAALGSWLAAEYARVSPSAHLA